MPPQGLRCAILTPSEGIWGGGQIYVETLCNWMCQHGWEAYILTSEAERYECPTMSVPSMRGKFARLVHGIGTGWRLARKVDVIVLNDLSALWLAPILRLFGHRVVGLLHLQLQNRSQNQLGHGRVAYELIKYSGRFCRALLSVNEDNLPVFGSSRCRFVGNYVPDWFFPSGGRAQEKEWDFLLVARLAPQKNIPLFLDLLSNLHRRGHSFSALIVGEGPELPAICTRIDDLGLQGYVQIRPWAARGDLPQVYDSARVFVVSSIHEGFATTLLEAHARGIPAVVTRSAGYCANFVEGHGASTGLSFNPGYITSAEFLEHVAQLMRDSVYLAEACIAKARLFSEARVLSSITAHLKNAARS